jgi:dUTP pyrophosphatase
MKIRIKRFDQTLPLPEYKTAGAAAMDLVARETTVIAPHKVGYVPLNIAVQVPDEYWVLVTARSSLHKKGVMMGNGVGVGDADFCGDEDEYKAILLNFTDQEVTIQRGDRIAQMMILKRDRVELEEVEQMEQKSRGGIGSTGDR